MIRDDDPRDRDEARDERDRDRREELADRRVGKPRRLRGLVADGYRPPHGGRPTPRADA